MADTSIFVVFLGVSVGILLLFQSVQPEPYMDEIFHIPQAQKYCLYQFKEWDPMITTLPGLYLISFTLLQLIVAVVLRTELHLHCSVFHLRCTNILFTVGNAWILLQILRKIHLDGQSNDKSKEKKTNLEFVVTSLNLCIFPVLYFFTFLYYTDVGATFFVLLMYYLSLKDQHALASLAGVISIVFRQTNVIWVVFVAGTTAMRNLQPSVTKHMDEKSVGTLSEITYYIVAFLDNFLVMFKVLVMYGVVVVGFVVFVVVNNGVVVGDRTSHTACLNLPQLFYFFVFSVSLGSPLLIDRVHQFYKFVKNTLSRPIVLMVLMLLLILSFIIVYKFTYIHKYLLADNRHYPFYIWRKIYTRHWSVKYLAIPGYLLAGWCLCSKLASKQSLTWQIIFWICVSLVLVPQKLLEFRYFVLPYLFYRLHIPVGSRCQILLEFCLYFAVNVTTIHLFLNRPFVWTHEPSQVQRFMW